MSTHGKGRTLLLGTYASAAHQASPTADGDRFFSALAEWAGAVRPVDVTGSPIEARHLEAGDDTLLFLFNHGTQAARSQVTLRRTGVGSVGAVDMTTGQAVDTASVAGGVRVEAALEPGAVQVLRVTPR
jgi:hypothetical protein